ncbi:hypothetical protein SAMN05443429_11315 [Cruoricaptor ignavus]|uniref:Dihaem cytochrome c n=1 Tax=Cruoricaptor ignavus TaxID=1118202 RepID=A0A1M6HL24_9FLAO|nr:hypothetical protein [Cruoricaptor ignavus]SHJ22872.1 hypothetical protein SAMN05443429_11315 [Cruoricaptor ignavus]
MKIYNLTAIIFSSVVPISCAEKVVKPISSNENPVKNQTESPAITENYDRDTAKALHDKACYKCHDLYKPKVYTDEQWVSIIKSMAPKANLNAEETSLVLHYVTSEN